MKLIYYIFLSYTLCLNSSFWRGFIFLPTLFEFLQNLEVQNLNEFDSNKSLGKYGKPVFHWATSSRLRFRASAWPNCWASHSWAGSPLPIQGRARTRQLVVVVAAAIDSSGRRWEVVSKGVGEHHGEVGPLFEVPGRGGSHRGWAVHGGSLRPQGNAGEGVFRWLWRLAWGSGRSTVTVGSSSTSRRAPTVAGRGGCQRGGRRRGGGWRWLGVVAGLAWLRGGRGRCLMRFVDGSWRRGRTTERERSGATEQDGKSESFVRESKKYLALSEVREDKVATSVGTIPVGSEQCRSGRPTMVRSASWMRARWCWVLWHMQKEFSRVGRASLQAGRLVTWVGPSIYFSK
jgi:hypothetical protein